MSRTKTILVLAFVVIVVLQLPGIYTAVQTHWLEKRIEETPLRSSSPEGFRVYKGVAHVHSSLGGHSSGSFDELIEAADVNKLDFVIMNEHVSHEYDTSAKTLREIHGKTLFLGGNELTSKEGDRFLVTEGAKSLGDLRPPTNQHLKEFAFDKDQLLIHAYPEKSPSGVLQGDGVEVFSLHTNAKQMNAFLFIYEAFWSFRSYPELTLARHFQRPDSNLEQYDREAAMRRLLLFSGVDAHSNLGLKLSDDANNHWIRIKFDDYRSIFRLVRNHVLLPDDEELTKESLIRALKEGQAYVSFDVLGSGVGFNFYAEGSGETVSMGGESDLVAGSYAKGGRAGTVSFRGLP